MDSLTGSVGLSLLVFSSFAIVLGAALSRRGPTSDRWAVAASLILVSQGIAALAASSHASAALAAPLTRLLAAVVAPLAAWAALGPGAGRNADRVLGVCLALCAALLAATLFLGPTAGTFNASWGDQAWSLLGLVLAVGSVIVVSVRRPPLWGIFSVGLGVLASGFIAHIGITPTSADTAPALAIALAVSAPILTLGAILVLLREGSPRSKATIAAERTRLERALRAVVRMGVAESAPEYAAALTEALGTWLDAEYCLLLTTPSSASGLSIGAGFDRERAASVPAAPLPRDGCPVLSQSLELARSVRLPAATHAPDSATILANLGLKGSSPALMVPVAVQGKAVAGIFLLSPIRQTDWDEATRLAVERLAPSFATHLDQLMQSPGEAPTESADESLEKARTRITELEAQRQADADEEPTWVGVQDMQVELERAHQTIDLMQAEIDRLRAALGRPAAAPAPDVDALHAELALALSALSEAKRGSAQPSIGSSGPLSPDSYQHALEDFRQPLTAIAGYTDLLLGESIGLLGATQRKFLQRIRTAVLRMEQSVASLTDRLLPGGASSAGAETSDLASSIETALEGIQEDLRTRELSIRLDLTEEPASVAGRPADVRRIVSDLLANAAAASPAGREIHVTLHTDPVEGVAILAVTNRGRGVPPDDLHRVFTAKRWREPVLGLGLDSRRLAAVKTLAESLGGRAWIESDEAEGTTFFILLPTVERPQR